jgi:hypothetical protein
MSFADLAREYAAREYIDPARKIGATIVQIRCGDVHSALRLTSRHALVCAVLGTKKFRRGGRIDPKRFAHLHISAALKESAGAPVGLVCRGCLPRPRRVSRRRSRRPVSRASLCGRWGFQAPAAWAKGRQEKSGGSLSGGTYRGTHRVGLSPPEVEKKETAPSERRMMPNKHTNPIAANEFFSRKSI